MVKVIVGMMGSSVIGGSSKMAQPAQVQEFLNVCKNYGVKEIDTARVYNGGKSEELLGEVHAGSDFAISTKAPGFSPGSLAGQKIKSNCYASLEALRQDKCKAVNELYQEDEFHRFGVSNIHVDEVTKIPEICRREHYVLPTVYQGGFNPLNRGAEEPLFPKLREMGIAFYAYSPLAGGFFSKPIDELRNPAQGSRYDAMKVFKDLYINETSLKALASLTDLCKEHWVPVKDATLRWFMHHSALGPSDGVILGASSTQQAEENLRACEGGPLPDDVVSSFEHMWDMLKPNAVNYYVGEPSKNVDCLAHGVSSGC